ncbi:MAG: hypothetical protein LH660_15740 [Phormidesmis sp. CAN_BIN36]|nr:hypothetical protein [Phormidesmis sp. CAN_BIN36]
MQSRDRTSANSKLKQRSSLKEGFDRVHNAHLGMKAYDHMPLQSEIGLQLTSN